MTAPGAARVRVSASIGVAEYLPGETLSELLSRADAVLYRAKSRGRNREEIDLEQNAPLMAASA